ncbi:TetR/AcrR family transcriptional regulator [Hyphobacterium sp.]|uniref:TetR/AcrR family transcriptional regulator n=1 Tax=Hyphobacterium sp. TaxID=2004662 RepID=UPI003BAD72E8
MKASVENTGVAKELGVRPAMQARSRATRQRILKVLEKSVQDGSVDRLTVADIAKKAKSSVGAFYGRFSDKAAALDALYSDRISSLSQMLMELNREARRHRDVHRWIGSVAQTSQTHAYDNQTLLSRLAGRPAGLAQLPPEVIDDTANTLSVLKIKPPHFAPPAAAFLMKMVMGLSRDAALFQASKNTDEAGRRVFVSDLQKAALWYLTAPSA